MEAKISMGGEYLDETEFKLRLKLNLYTMRKRADRIIEDGVFTV